MIPWMNDTIASARTNVNLLRSEHEGLENRIAAYHARIQAALRAGRRDIALNYATTVEELQQALDRNRIQLESAQAALERAEKIKQAFLKEKERKTRETIQAIRDSERAKWERKVADALQSFEPGTIDQTHKEMIERTRKQAALDRAYLDIAMDEKESAIIEEAGKLKANALVTRYERELGLNGPEPINSHKPDSGKPRSLPPDA